MQKELSKLPSFGFSNMLKINASNNVISQQDNKTEKKNTFFLSNTNPAPDSYVPHDVILLVITSNNLMVAYFSGSQGGRFQFDNINVSTKDSLECVGEVLPPFFCQHRVQDGIQCALKILGVNILDKIPLF